MQIKQIEIKNNINTYYQKVDDIKQYYENNKKSLENQEKQEINRLNLPLQKRLTQIYLEINNLEPNKNQELANKLKEIQEQFISHQLSKEIIKPGKIQGFGKNYTQRLHDYGIVTANDISYYSVIQIYGIGDYRASVLVSWRDQILDKVKQHMPIALPKSIEDEIILRYKNTLINLQNEKQQINNNIIQNTSLTKQKYKTKQDYLTRKLNKELYQINQRFNISKQENKLMNINMKISDLTQQFNSHKNWNFFVYILRILSIV